MHGDPDLLSLGDRLHGVIDVLLGFTELAVLVAVVVDLLEQADDFFEAETAAWGLTVQRALPTAPLFLNRTSASKEWRRASLLHTTCVAWSSAILRARKPSILAAKGDQGGSRQGSGSLLVLTSLRPDAVLLYKSPKVASMASPGLKPRVVRTNCPRPNCGRSWRHTGFLVDAATCKPDARTKRPLRPTRTNKCFKRIAGAVKTTGSFVRTGLVLGSRWPGLLFKARRFLNGFAASRHGLCGFAWRAGLALHLRVARRTRLTSYEAAPNSGTPVLRGLPRPPRGAAATTP